MRVPAAPAQALSITALLPHGGDMRLIDALIECDEDTARAACEVRAGAWYIRDAAMPAWIALELMAQTVAAYVSYHKRARGLPPVQGYLLGTRRFRTLLPAFDIGAKLEIVTQRQYQEASGLGAFDCVIELDGSRVAQAILTVYDPR